MRRRIRLPRFCFLWVFPWFLGACSVSDVQGYRKIHTACSGLSLTQPFLDVPTFRRLFSCFNSNGALDPIQGLVARLSEEELQALVDFQNQYFFGNPKLIFQFEQTYRTLWQRKSLDEVFHQFGRMIENDEFIASSLAVLKDKYGAGKNGKLLKAFEVVSKAMDPRAWADLIDLGLTLSQSRAFASLQNHFQGADFQSILALVNGFFSYPDDGRVEVILRSRLLEALDRTVGVNSDELKRGVPRITSVLQALFQNQGELAAELASLYQVLHQAPISCLEGSEEVADGVMHWIRELSVHSSSSPAEFIHRTHKLQLVTLKPFCSFPAELQRFYGAIEKLADTTAIVPAADFIRAWYQESRFSEGTLPKTVDGVHRLLPILAELTRRGAWDDLVLTVSLLRLEDRPRLKGLLDFLVRPDPALGGQSLYAVLSDSGGKASPRLPRLLAEMLFSLRRFTEAPDPLLEPILKSFRSVFYINDVHPVVDLLRGVMADASKNEKFFDLVFRISEMPEFRKSLQLLSRMAQDDRLKDLVGSLVNLFSKFGQEGRMDLHLGVEPKFNPDSHRRHNLVSADLIPFPLEVHPPVSEGELACRQLDLNVSLAHYGKPGFPNQLSEMVSCLNSHGGYEDVEKSIRFLRESKIEGERDFFGYSISLIQDLKLDQVKAGFLVDRWIEASRDGRFNRLLEGIGYWLTPGSLVEPLLALAPAWMKQRHALDRLQGFFSQMIRNPSLPSVLGWLHDLWEVQPQRPPFPRWVPEKYDLAQIARWVKTKEGGSAEKIQERVAEIVDDYQTAVTNGDLGERGQPRRKWILQEFWEEFQPLLKILKEPRQGGGWTFDALFRFGRYFSLARGETPSVKKHYPQERLLEWLRERANDPQLITYYYPGDLQPRVRLVSSLDRLELVLINADFNAPVLGTHFGLKFMADLAQAWGDEPPSLWPAVIRKKARSGEKIKTLAEVVQEINETQWKVELLLGWLPGLGEIKNKLYNVHQVLSVLQENVDNDGLKVLRDLFFEFHSSSSKEGQAATSDANHLSAILKMVRLGVFRRIGRGIQETPLEEFPALRALFATLLEGVKTPGLRDGVETLLVRDPHFGLISEVLGETFVSLEGSSARKFRQLVFYSLANISSLGLTESVATELGVIIGQEWEYLKKHSESVGAFFRSAAFSDFARTLFEEAGRSPDQREAKRQFAGLMKEALSEPQRGLDLLRMVQAVSEDKAAAKAWRRFHVRREALEADEGYRKLRLGEIFQELLEFLEERSGRADSADLACHFKEFLARRLEAKDLDRFLLLASSTPESGARLAQVLGTVAAEIQKGDLQEFFSMIQRSISPSKK